MLAELNPDQELPDAIYLASLDHAVTPEEVAFRNVLVFHRDCLNGGLDQALENTDQAPATVTEAFRSVGLSAVADLLDKAALVWRREEDVDELTDYYVQFTFGEDNDQPDAVESAAVRYAQLHEGAFASITGAAERGDFTTFDISGLG